MLNLFLRMSAIGRSVRLVLAACLLLVVQVVQAAEPLTLGILAYLPKEQMIERYQPLANYLSESLSGRDVRLLPLSYEGDQVEEAIANQRIDLLLTNPSHFIKLRIHHNLSGAMLTQVVLRNSVPVSSFGGVIIARADNAQIDGLDDLVDKHVVAADPRSLGGYQAQVYEAMQQGVELSGNIEFLKKHNKVVTAVVEGKADVGFIRSGVLEAMVKAGQLTAGQVKVLSPKAVDTFPFALSTDLYPEWPLLALPRLQDREIRQVASALLALDMYHPAAQAARIGGFDPPKDYLSVENLARALRVPPYDQLPEFTLADILEKHQLAVVLLSICISVIVFLLLLLYRRNIQLSRNAENLRRAASVFANTREGISLTDREGTILDVNTAFEQMTGYSRAEVIGKNTRMLKSNSQSPEFYTEMWSALQSRGEWQGEVWNRHKSGTKYAVQLTIGAVHDTTGALEGYVGLFSNITLQKEYQHRLEQIAHFDVITGLPNRILFYQRLQQEMALAKRYTKKLGVVFLDLDGFKAVNDTYGHATGDKLLSSLAMRMRETMRQEDTLARIGGDEFIATLHDFSVEGDGEQILSRLLDVTSQPVEIDGDLIQVSVSIGVAIYPQDEDVEADELISQADEAMYAAKRAGKNCYRVFEFDLTE